MRYTITGAPRVGEGQDRDRQWRRRDAACAAIVTAYDAASGKLAWRFYLTPNPEGQPDGAASDDVLKATAAGSWGDGEWREERRRRHRLGLDDL